MSKSARRPQQLYQIVMWILSVIFAGFLIGLGSLVIRDLPRVDGSITLTDFADTTQIERIDTEISAAETQANALSRQIEDETALLESASADYASNRLTFENWIATRSATEAADTNPQVIARTRQLEALQATERAALKRVEATRTQRLSQDRAVSDLRDQRRSVLDAGRGEFRAAQRAQELRVFLYRLALTLPLLLISAWMVLKMRESSYWPLYRGFVLFSLFAFFVELVPYLPSYGGYVRFGVGIMAVIVAGHFLIRGMRKYLVRKQSEEARSEVERRQSIQYEVALKKIAGKTCPGCDRSIVTRDDARTDFCVHCGIRLQEDCNACGERNISFHRFCLSCGVPKPIQPDVQDLPPDTSLA